MPRFYAIKQFCAKDEPAIIHKISIPLPSEHGFYRSVGTLNAFLHSNKDRNNFWALHPKTAKANGIKARKPTHKHWYYGVGDWREFEAIIARPLFKQDADLQVVEHASIWDFYKHIGFDYKTEKWSKHLITKALKPDEMPY